MFFVYKFSVFQALKQTRKLTQGFKNLMNSKFYSKTRREFQFNLN
jgi:hypothetical protein